MEVVNFRTHLAREDPVIVTIGNFDGVHLGHQFIIRKMVKEARQRQCSSILVSFDPHPQEVVHPQRTVAKLCTPSLRNRILKDLDLDAVHIIHFTSEFSQLSPEDFALEFLIERFNLVKLIIGHDFHFGRKRAGNADLLQRFSQEYHFELEEISPVQIGNQTVSSTLIRQLIKENRFDEIPQFLGRAYSLYSSIERGDQRGRTIGFPTANLRTQNSIPLENGVYVSRAKVRNQIYQGVTNVGVRPTFGLNEQIVETFLFDFSDDIYGETMEVWPLKQLRKEKKFSGLNSLQEQIQKDTESAQSFFQSQQAR
ncbi:MAG: bifunctional riboflavin kinase/FAD synthetase [SAR324 cluster bacterium]|nr:bifunctional riboflavin kinase/FAD synthetase [SAR324 cluster bacterium]